MEEAVMSSNNIRRLTHVGIYAACVGAMLATSMSLAQDEVQVVGQSPRQPDPEVRAITSCLAEFTQALFPNGAPPVHTVVKTTVGHVPGSIYWRHTDVDMQADVRDTGKVIAQSRCNVSRDGRVVNLHTRVNDPSLLAGLAPRDVQVRLASR
jgi:hypothetical protein